MTARPSPPATPAPVVPGVLADPLLSIRRLTKESGVPTKELYELFPKGPAKKAAKIAGIPKPTGCI